MGGPLSFIEIEMSVSLRTLGSSESLNAVMAVLEHVGGQEGEQREALGLWQTAKPLSLPRRKALV